MPNTKSTTEDILVSGKIPQAMAKQVAKMLVDGYKPHRKSRESADNKGWNTPGGCITSAYYKFCRLIATSEFGCTLTMEARRQPAKSAEECREIAHYMLRLAGILETKKAQADV